MLFDGAMRVADIGIVGATRGPTIKPGSTYFIIDQYGEISHAGSVACFIDG
jgi:hypothetical protein